MASVPAGRMLRSLSMPWRDAAIIALAVLSLRMWIVGNPHVHVDEEFYLLVGGRMWEGAMPYVDIWDRKPIGLFLIYATAALFGEGVVAYQLLAMLFVLATSVIVYGMARMFADRPSAVIAAIAYPVFLNLLEGMGGQAPVFYNLLVTGAAAILIRLFMQRLAVAGPQLLWHGAAVMLLAGLAIQVKYSVVGEAVGFGLLLIGLMWQRRGLYAAVGGGVLWASIALAPTLLALLYFAARGDADIFAHANFFSIAARGGDPAEWVIGRFIGIVKVLAGPALIGIAGAVAARCAGTLTPDGGARRFILIWNGLAWLAFLGFGTFFPHYGLPLAAPTALLFAFASGRWLVLRSIVLMGGALVSVKTVHHEVGSAGGGAVIRSTLAAMGPSRNCPFFYEGSPILYHLGHYCLPTRYAFPYHLSIVREHSALGIDADAELRRVLSRNPEYIVIRLPFSSAHRPQSDAMVMQTLRARYRPIISTTQWVTYQVVLYRLRPGFTPLPNDARNMHYPRPPAAW